MLQVPLKMGDEQALRGPVAHRGRQVVQALGTIGAKLHGTITAGVLGASTGATPA